MRKLLLLLFPALSFLSVAAQMSERIETDRPDQTESPYLVPLHYFQGEFGFNQVWLKDGVRQVIHPTSLLKYGLTNRLELRLEISPYTEVIEKAAQKQTQLMLEPVEIGAKIRLFEEKGWRPKTSVIAHLGIPFAGNKVFRSTPAVYSATFTMQNSFSDAVALGYNLGVGRTVEETTEIFYTIAPGFNVGKRWYAYVEAFGSLANRQMDHNFDAGIAYHPSNNTKIDFSAGFGLAPSELKHYMALGFSFRLPVR